MTPLTDSDLQCFNALRQLKVLLLDSTEHFDDDGYPITIVNTPPIRDLTPNERIAAAFTIAHEKFEKYITTINIKNNTKESVEKEFKEKNEIDLEKPDISSIKLDSNYDSPSCSKTNIANIDNNNENVDEETNGAKKELIEEEPSTSATANTNGETERKSIAEEVRLARLRFYCPEHVPAENQETNHLPTIQQPNHHVIVLRVNPHRVQHNHIDRLIHHPIFWNMLSPEPNAENANNAPAAADENAQLPIVRARDSNCHLAYMLNNTPPPMPTCHFSIRAISRDRLSDRGICSFGRPPNQVDRQIVWIRLEQYPRENTLHKIVLRNYRLISDMSLRHLVQVSPNLIYLDVSGTSVTSEGVRAFSAQKPLCTVIAEHLHADVKISEADPFIF